MQQVLEAQQQTIQKWQEDRKKIRDLLPGFDSLITELSEMSNSENDPAAATINIEKGLSRIYRVIYDHTHPPEW